MNDNDFEKFCSELKEEKRQYVNKKFDDFLKDKTESEKEDLSNRLKEMIDYASGRHDWHDNIRVNLLNIGIGIIGFSLAIASLAAALDGKFSILSKWFLWTFIITIVLTGICVIYRYNKGVSKNHPYRKIVDIRSWYFIYNFSDKLKDHIKGFTPQKQRAVSKTFISYKKALDRWLEYASEKNAFIKEDFEQVMILQILQSHKRNEGKVMARVIFGGIILSIIPFTLFIVSAVFTERAEQHKVIKVNYSGNTDSTTKAVILDILPDDDNNSE